MFESLNASQATLVAPESTTTLVFSKPSAINTTLLRNGRPLMTVSTLDAGAERTTISDAEAGAGEVLVVVQRRALLSDTVTFARHYGGRSLKLKDWLKEDVLENGHTTWTIQTPVGNFVWRTDVALRLALCPESNLEHPLAWAQLHTETTPFGLVLTRGTEQFREEIVASFLILEQRMRMREKMYYRAHGLSGAMR
ncbi:hypothetical protein GALMADRAFT_104055 [Galerina marginata CBS 339.88]|uniref:DUF6593 domain-containing protein n=1 Tax=Galerina marginata (strain CBS 339.88) TaxID=685588 RepID=A0A067SRF7_GALM3|nr:hypothetical protein GALMADRAFT_104055 [Galerina marginata CBS 339.88]